VFTTADVFVIAVEGYRKATHKHASRCLQEVLWWTVGN